MYLSRACGSSVSTISLSRLWQTLEEINEWNDMNNVNSSRLEDTANVGLLLHSVSYLLCAIGISLLQLLRIWRLMSSYSWRPKGLHPGVSSAFFLQKSCTPWMRPSKTFFSSANSGISLPRFFTGWLPTAAWETVTHISISVNTLECVTWIVSKNGLPTRVCQLERWCLYYPWAAARALLRWEPPHADHKQEGIGGPQASSHSTHLASPRPHTRISAGLHKFSPAHI